MMRRKSRRFWLLSLPALLLGTALWMHSRLPRPASPADEWLWEEGEVTQKLTIRGTEGSEKLIAVTDHQTIREFLRTFNCCTPWTRKFNTKFDDPASSLAGLSFQLANKDVCFLVKAGKQIYLVRHRYVQGEDKNHSSITSCLLTSQSTIRAFQLFRQMIERAKHKDPQVQTLPFQIKVD